MAPVEEQLIQVNMKGSEANLAFPNMLNEQFDTFSAVVQAGDSAPSQQQYEVFKMLRGQLDQQLAAWKQIMSSGRACLQRSHEEQQHAGAVLAAGRRVRPCFRAVYNLEDRLATVKNTILRRHLLRRIMKQRTKAEAAAVGFWSFRNCSHPFVCI